MYLFTMLTVTPAHTKLKSSESRQNYFLTQVVYLMFMYMPWCYVACTVIIFKLFANCTENTNNMRQDYISDFWRQMCRYKNYKACPFSDVTYCHRVCRKGTRKQCLGCGVLPETQVHQQSCLVWLKPYQYHLLHVLSCTPHLLPPWQGALSWCGSGD